MNIPQSISNTSNPTSAKKSQSLTWDEKVLDEKNFSKPNEIFTLVDSTYSAESIGPSAKMIG